ncbi:MAG TPA: PQQ-binding-like beta-propeller repeat protein [Verrucomicrobiae bacterium]|nr:PQQ-binding-like beta-propeller repeat protein [Verrucomicrobiae bacterium]
MKPLLSLRLVASTLAATLFTTVTSTLAAPVQGWLEWRGANRLSVSAETGLPDKIDAKNALWTAPFPGQSAPVIANGKLYINGFLGEGPDLTEVVACFDAETGKLQWEHRENDFLSDTIYLRYSISSPSVDAETGNVYVQGTQGLLMCFTADGKLLWKHSLMEEYGRLTFPNARTASPVIDQDLVITRGITSAWGAHGAAGDRFYAFDKKTGELVWSSAPGGRPQDNTFSHPWLDFWNGQRVLYSAGGDCTLVAINARTGEPLWRVLIAKAGAKGGINAAVVRHKDKLIVIHESENLDSSEIGRMAAMKIPSSITKTNPLVPHIFEPKALEQWRNEVGSLSSSPVIVGDTLYEVNGTGDLCAVDANTGKVLWKHKLAIEQRQSTPFYADGRLYVAVYISSQGADKVATGGGDSGGNGDLFVIKPGTTGCEILSRTTLEGRCYGSPIAYNGKVYIQTDRKLYCFGRAGKNPGLPPESPAVAWPKPGPKKALQLVPYEVMLKPGDVQSFRVRAIDANGFVTDDNIDPKTLQWEPFVPPGALVRAYMKGTFGPDGRLTAAKDNVPSAGQFQASLGELKGYVKGRVLSILPLKQDFESFELSNVTTNTVEPETKFAYPPLPWNSARFRFEVRQAPGEGGTKALCKTIDNKLFQRGTIYIGHPDMKGYTIEVDVMTEGNRRKMSEAGVVNQRYYVILKGNSQEIEVSSNQERLKQSAPFKWAPNTWYRLKARVDVAADGSGVVRGKAWKRGEPEPEAWVIEVKHRSAHPTGCPGLFSFAPQDQRTYHDNIVVTANQ